MMDIAMRVEVCEHRDGFFPPVLTAKPARRMRQPKHPYHKHKRRHGLKRPWNTESRGALVRIVGATINERRAVLHEVLYQDPPSDGPLLKRDHASADLLGCNLGLIHWHNG